MGLDPHPSSARAYDVPGGGLSLDGARWVASRSNFLVHVNVLAGLFRGKMRAMLTDAHGAGQLKFFNTHARLADKKTFKRFIALLRHIKWVVYRRRSLDPNRCCAIFPVTPTVSLSPTAASLQPTTPASRSAGKTPGRWKTMRLHPHEFIRRFLLHVLPTGFHRIRHLMQLMR